MFPFDDYQPSSPILPGSGDLLASTGSDDGTILTVMLIVGLVIIIVGAIMAGKGRR